MITVTEEAKEILRGYWYPEGTALRLDSVNRHQPDVEIHVRLGAGPPQGDDQIVKHEGEDLLRIASHVSEELNGGTIGLVETLEGTAVSVKPPPLPPNTPLMDGW